jgi:signal transduction histidine kinase
VLNSVQAIKGSGTLRIRTDAKNKEILISDTGCGIPQKDLENIFDLFYTTKSSGTGLGLPTAYKIIKEHHGEITISSQEGKGTQITIRLS